jgi:hypothetical protein
MLSLSSRNPSQPKRGYLLLPWHCREVLMELETHKPKFVESDLGFVLREELQSSITKVSVRILLWTLPVILELMQKDERETHFREVFVFGVLQARGVCKAERPSQSWAQGTTHIQEAHKTTAKHYQEYTRQTTNNCTNHTRYFKYQRCLTTRDVLGLVLFILGSWLAIVVEVFIFLDSRLSRNLMAVEDKVAVLLSHWCWLGKCSFVSLLVSHHTVVRSSEGLLKFAIGGIHARQT